jgi:hypothetical protein
MCVTGSAAAEKGGLRAEVTELQAAVAENTFQIINLNENRNIVLSAGYTGIAGFGQFYIHLDGRSADDCSVFVGSRSVARITDGSATMLLDPFDIMDAAQVPEFINKAVNIPMQVGCLPNDDGFVDRGHVTGTLYPIQAPLPHDHEG